MINNRLALTLSRSIPVYVYFYFWYAKLWVALIDDQLDEVKWGSIIHLLNCLQLDGHFQSNFLSFVQTPPLYDATTCSNTHRLVGTSSAHHNSQIGEVTYPWAMLSTWRRWQSCKQRRLNHKNLHQISLLYWQNKIFYHRIPTCEKNKAHFESFQSNAHFIVNFYF